MTTVPAPDLAVRALIEAEAPRFIAELSEWLRIPSVSADPQRAPDVRRSAEWLADGLDRTGFPTVEIWETGDGAGLPAVFAEWPAEDPGAPAVLVYGHHDVQPVEPLERWDSPPFEPAVRGDQLLGRGTTDDKGQVWMHTLGLRAHLAATGRAAPAVTLKILVEGEEESGSPHFASLLRDNRERLRCDTVVVSDTTMWAPDVPSVCTAMRGVLHCQVDLSGPATDVHSGTFGGSIPNPLTALCEVLAGLHDARGRVTLPGFYDRVIPLDDVQRQLLARLPFSEQRWLAMAGSRATAGEEGFTTLERVWARPTAEVNGLWGGHTGPGGKTIVPSAAHAKLSFRLVADQEPTEVQAGLRSWLATTVPPGIEWQVGFGSDGVRPCHTPLHHPALRALTRAMARAFGGEVLYTREGGSGPESDLADVLDAPVIFLGAGLPDDRQHAPNEKVELPLLFKGAEAAAYLWSELAAGSGTRGTA